MYDVKIVFSVDSRECESQHSSKWYLHGVFHSVCLQHQQRVLLVALSDRLLKSDDHRSTHAVRTMQQKELADVVVFDFVIVFGAVHAHKCRIHLLRQ
jgi:hypothetical protein